MLMNSTRTDVVRYEYIKSSIHTVWIEYTFTEICEVEVYRQSMRYKDHVEEDLEDENEEEWPKYGRNGGVEDCQEDKNAQSIVTAN